MWYNTLKPQLCDEIVIKQLHGADQDFFIKLLQVHMSYEVHMS